MDINAFQHYYFLNNWNKENKQDLVAAAETYISTHSSLPGYQNGKNKYAKVDQIPNGAEIAVPNDATNESRRLIYYNLQD